MKTMTTALNTSRRRNWNRLDIYWTYWMWWMKTPIKRTMKVTVKSTPTINATHTTKAIRTTKATKIKEYPSYPHTSILCFWWVQPELQRSFVGTSNSRCGNSLLCFISKYLPGQMVTFVMSKSNPMSSFLIGLRMESVVRFIFIYLVVNRFPERKMKEMTDVKYLSSEGLKWDDPIKGR